MPRMKLDDRDFNVKELDVEYERSDFKRYDGDIPRTGTILICRVTKMWWTSSGDGTSAMKVLAVAEGNVGDRKKYNGLPVWDFLTFKPEAAFRYMPFLDTFQITVHDIKRKMMVADEDENLGTPIEAIADWVVGSDDALCKIVIRNNPQYGAEPDREGWMELDQATVGGDDDDDDEEEDDEPPARPTRSANRRSGARSAASSSRGAAGTRRGRPEPEPEPDDEDYDDEDDEEADDYDEEAEDEEAEEEAEPARPARPSGRRAAAPARSRSGTARAASRDGSSHRASGSSGRTGGRSGRSRSAEGERASRAADRDRRGRGSDDDPPF